MNKLNLFPSLSNFYNQTKPLMATRSAQATLGEGQIVFNAESISYDDFEKYFVSYDSIEDLYKQINEIDVVSELIKKGVKESVRTKCAENTAAIQLIWNNWDSTKVMMNNSFNTIAIFSGTISDLFTNSITNADKIKNGDTSAATKAQLISDINDIKSLASSSTGKISSVQINLANFGTKLDDQPALMNDMTTAVSDELKLSQDEQDAILKEIVALKKKMDAYNAGAIAAAAAAGATLVGLGVTFMFGPIGWITFSLFLTAEAALLATAAALAVEANAVQSSIDKCQVKYESYTGVIAALTSAEATLTTAAKSYDTASAALPGVAIPWNALGADMTLLEEYVAKEIVDYDELIYNLAYAKNIWDEVAYDCEILSGKIRLIKSDEHFIVSDLDNEEKLKAIIERVLAA